MIQKRGRIHEKEKQEISLARRKGGRNEKKKEKKVKYGEFFVKLPSLILAAALQSVTAYVFLEER